MSFGNLQDLTEATHKETAQYCSRLEQLVTKVMSLAAQEAEEMRKALQEEEEKRKKTLCDISSLIEKYDDLNAMKQFIGHLMTFIGDEDFPYP